LLRSKIISSVAAVALLIMPRLDRTNSIYGQTVALSRTAAYIVCLHFSRRLISHLPVV